MDENIQKSIDQNAIGNQFTVSPIPAHTHNGSDSLLITTVNLPLETPIKFGLGGIISTSNSRTIAPGSAGEITQTIISSGKDQTGTVGFKGGNLQLNLLHLPQSASNQSFITAQRPPLYSNITGTTISTTLGGNTVTTSGYGFTTNSLAGALINIYNSAGLVETQTIASNTSTVITISGTWLATTTNGTLGIFQPVFFGASDTPYQRLYTQEGDTAGIRFGVGVTNGGQNGLLYMDAAGDLYWRNKAGASTKLN